MKKWLVGIAILIAGSVLVYALPYQPKTTLTWTAPTINTDGTPLTDLSGYKLYWGTVSGTYTGSKDVGNVLTANIQQALAITPRGNYCFVVTAYDLALNESSYSNEICNDFKKQSSSPKTLVIQ
mgnify:CR=1 FL=1